MEKEIWKKAICKEDDILVSNKGNVWNARKNKPMPKFLAGRGYYAISLQKNKKKKNYLVSRLVAIAFIPNPENKATINHINGIKTDNRVENLEWVTYRENNIHALKTGLNQNKGKCKPVLQISNGVVIKEYKSLNQACKENNIDPKQMWCVLNKKRCKTAKGFNWEYKEKCS